MIIEGGFTTGRDTEVKPLFLCNENILTLATKIRFQYNEIRRSVTEKGGCGGKLTVWGQA